MPRPSLLLLGLVWEPHSGVAALLRLRVFLHIVQVVAEARLDPGLGQMGQLPLPGESTKVVTQPPGPSLCFLHGLGGIFPCTPTGWVHASPLPRACVLLHTWGRSVLS